MVPCDREDVWTMIPWIGRSFIHELNYAQTVGRPLPDIYPDYLGKMKYVSRQGEYGDLIEPETSSYRLLKAGRWGR